MNLTTTPSGWTSTLPGRFSPARLIGLAGEGVDQLASAWRVVGLYEKATGAIVGFARAVSDGVALDYLADVYVLSEARNQGLGKELVATTIEGGTGKGFRWMLHTSRRPGPL